MASHDPATPERSGRLWLYAPFVMLALVALAWTAAWFVIRDRTAQALDDAIAREAAAGRVWTCRDRTIGGYPFRLEVTCSELTLARGPATAAFGRVLSVAQVYNPRHVITEIAGPLKATDGGSALEGSWRLLQTSVHVAGDGLGRASLAMDGGAFRGRGAGPAGVPVDFQASAERLEAHLRPDPARGGPEGAYDVAIRADKALIPALDPLLGGAEPADLFANAVVTQVPAFATSSGPDGLERWRTAGGRIEVERLHVAKGARRLELKGRLGLDDLHRPTARLDVQAAGLEGLVASLTGGRAPGAADALLGLLTGGGRPRPEAPGTAPGQKPGEPALRPLPPLTLENGRVLLGPFPIPGVRLNPVY
jgi:hypothetical protein